MSKAGMLSAFLSFFGNKVIENLGSVCMLGKFERGKGNWLFKTILHFFFFSCKSEESLLQNSGFLNAINLSALAACLNCF